MVNKIDRITEIHVRHRRPTTTINGAFMTPRGSYVNAKMTLWAITESGDHVWLETRTGLDTKRIEAKVRKYQSENQEKVGRAIEYALPRLGTTCFLRRYIKDVQ